MPTYDYSCDGCGHTFEYFQPMSDRVLRKCPECGELRLRRLIGPGAGFLFRGSGFYITDYRSDSYKAAASTEKGATPAGSAAGDPSGSGGNTPSAGPSPGGNGTSSAGKASAKAENKTAKRAPKKATA
ncbi:MAG: FmdB family zinc ribbon protein [Planctomycetota bacterium]